MTDVREGHTNCDNAAVMQGYTRHVLIELGGTTGFAALVKPATDFDSCFRCFDTDNQEWLNVNGWHLTSLEDA